MRHSAERSGEITIAYLYDTGPLFIAGLAAENFKKLLPFLRIGGLKFKMIGTADTHGIEIELAGKINDKKLLIGSDHRIDFRPGGGLSIFPGPHGRGLFFWCFYLYNGVALYTRRIHGLERFLPDEPILRKAVLFLKR